jgi:predicted metal-binding protein
MRATVTDHRDIRAAADLTILVCRGCCCGTAQKHPDVDHEAQLHALEAAAARTPGARVRAVDCVDECSRSNVIVVRLREASTSTTLWLGEMLTEAKTKLLADWIAAGGPRTAPLPPRLAFAAFAPGNDAVCAVERMEREPRV